MKSFDELLPELLQAVRPIEERRLETLRSKSVGLKWIGGIILGAVLASLAGVAAFGSAIPAIVLGISGLLASGIVYAHWLSKPFEIYRSHFKHEFIGRLLNSIADDVRYAPEGDTIVMDEYRGSELYPRSVDRETIRDTIACRVGKTNLVISELHTEYKTTSTDKDGNTKTSWHTIFRGLFISADFHKDFRGATFVRSDVAEKTFGIVGRFFQKPIFSTNELVLLEDPDFEREFVVHSSDQVEARYILSTSLMQKMWELKQRFSDSVEFSFLRSRMFIAISGNRDYFEPTLSRSLLDTEYLKEFLGQAQLCLGIVEDLGLNVRIWTKQ